MPGVVSAMPRPPLTLDLMHGVKFDESAQRRFCALIARGRSPALAAEDIGFAPSTIKRAVKNDRAFADAYSNALDQVNGGVEEVLLDKALDGDLGALKMWLTNRQPQRWSDTRILQAQLTGPGGGPLQIAQASALALREVLMAPETRQAAIEMARSIPAIGAGDDIIEGEVIE